jgi:hypothetical protein
MVAGQAHLYGCTYHRLFASACEKICLRQLVEGMA